MSNPTQTEALTLSYKFPAPRELVLRCFTRAAHLRHWWGPAGFTIAVCRFERRPGGVFHYRMQTPVSYSLSDKEVWGRFVYQEISLLERIVLLSAFCDERGTLTRHPMRPTWPMQVLQDFTFAEQSGQTCVTLWATPYQATRLERETFVASRSLIDNDINDTFAQLESYLAKLMHSLPHQAPLIAPALRADFARNEEIELV
jgi:uncharacterized protein YndB with AHSA1/START domain